MADWQYIAQSNTVEGFQSQFPNIEELPAGTPVYVHIDLPPWLPIGNIANLAGAEWFAQRLADAHFQVEDVYGEPGYIEVTGHMLGSPMVLVIVAIAAAVSILGISWAVTNIYLAADLSNREQKRIDLARELEAKRYPPDEIARLLEQIDTGAPKAVGPLGNDTGILGLPSWALPVALIVAGLMLLRK